MKTKYILIFIIALISSIFCSCTKWIDLCAYNRSNDSIAVLCNIFENGVHYPDTTMQKDTTVILSSGTKYNVIENLLNFGKVGPNERKVIWSDDSNYPDIICVFILSQDTINKYPWEEIRRTNNYLVRYDYTREQLEGLDYTIEYPPTSRMKDIHMYPEFSTFYKSNE